MAASDVLLGAIVPILEEPEADAGCFGDLFDGGFDADACSKDFFMPEQLFVNVHMPATDNGYESAEPTPKEEQSQMINQQQQQQSTFFPLENSMVVDDTSKHLFKLPHQPKQQQIFEDPSTDHQPPQQEEDNRTSKSQMDMAEDSESTSSSRPQSPIDDNINDNGSTTTTTTQSRHAMSTRKRRINVVPSSPDISPANSPRSTHSTGNNNSSSDRRLHSCLWCPKKFVTTGHLKQHVRIHTGDRPFQCSWCDKSFAQCGDLKRHERIHTGEKPFKCNTCGKCFAQCGNLKKHERIHARDAKNNKKGGARAGKKKATTTRATVTTAVKASNANNTVKDSNITIPRPQQQQVATSPNVRQQSFPEDLKKTESKVDRSRRHARELRQKKKAYIQCLETTLNEMDVRDSQLRQELTDTKQQLMNLQTMYNDLLQRVAQVQHSQMMF